MKLIKKNKYELKQFGICLITWTIPAWQKCPSEEVEKNFSTNMKNKFTRSTFNFKVEANCATAQKKCKCCSLCITPIEQFCNKILLRLNNNLMKYPDVLISHRLDSFFQLWHRWFNFLHLHGDKALIANPDHAKVFSKLIHSRFRFATKNCVDSSN